MSKVSIAAALVQSDAVFIMPSSGGSVGQTLVHNGNHPTIAGAKILAWQSLTGVGSDFISYGQSQELSLVQLRTARRNLFVGSAPSISYNGSGEVSSITYSDGSIKTFTYAGGLLTRIDHTYSNPSKTYRKDFSYDVSNKLTSISESLL